MVNVVALTFDGGDNVLVEIDDDTTGEVSRSEQLVSQAGVALREAFERVCPTLQAALATIRAGSEAPTEVSVQFGMKISATARSEATCIITAAWRH
jgi:Trypsin-co-occurring domain 1